MLLFYLKYSRIRNKNSSSSNSISCALEFSHWGRASCFVEFSFSFNIKINRLTHLLPIVVIILTHQFEKLSSSVCIFKVIPNKLLKKKKNGVYLWKVLKCVCLLWNDVNHYLWIWSTLTDDNLLNYNGEYDFCKKIHAYLE